MSTNYHTPIQEGAPANAEEFNNPLAEIDQAITDIMLTEKDGHIIQNEGSDLPQQQRLNFKGAGVVATNNAGASRTDITIAGGVTDHGALTGLGDDDHTQYHNDTRGDARYQVKYLGKTTAPTVNDDSADGYLIGDHWIDETNDKEYVCLDNSVGAAVWTETTQSGASVLANAEGQGKNYKFDVAITANDLVVSLKTLAGTNPSVGDPIKIVIGGTERTISAALSVTLADATNWFGFGSADKAALEQDLFVYLGYNATDGVTFGVSPIPYASKYSDFSVTNTNETYCKISNITNAAANDPYVVIGRIAATLSAGPGYTWTSTSQSAPTADNTKNYPIYETRKLSFNVQPTNITLGNGTWETYYQRIMRRTVLSVRLNAGSTTTIGGNASIALPTTAKHAPTGVTYMAVGSISIVDAGVSLYSGIALLENTTSMSLRVINSSATYGTFAYVTSGVPFTIGNTDIVQIDAEYWN